LLREQANIQDPVTFVDREADPSSQPLPPPLRGDQEQAAERSHWEDLEKTELISLVEKLTEEASRTNIILRSLQQDRDLIIEYREVFASALRLADRLVASKQREAKVASCTQGVSALPETIDRHWEEVCQGSECWRDWWNSGRPKQLRHAPELAIPPTQPGNQTPPEATPSSTSVAEPPPPPSSTPVSLPTSSGLNTSTSQTHSTATSTQNQTHTNTLPAVPPTPPATPAPAPAPAVPASSTSTAGNTTTRKKKYKKKNRNSEVRGASTTQGAGPSRRQTPAKPTQICQYCNQKGHSTEDCHTRTAELRQERLLRQVLAEGRYLAAVSPSVTPHLQPFPQSRPFSAQPVNWGHTQGWQWIPPGLRYPQLSPCHTPSGRTTTLSNMHDAYENLLTVQGLKDHVTFPTHERGGTLDPVISDLEEDTLSCHQLGLVGSSDHHAVLTQVDMGVARDESTTRTVWLWDRADWGSLRRDLRRTDWPSILQGGAEVQARAFTSRLLALQEQHVPHPQFLASYIETDCLFKTTTLLTGQPRRECCVSRRVFPFRVASALASFVR
ncbi:hypothetical protein O3P69_011770, partial [Scylla paramamosain]